MPGVSPPNHQPNPTPKEFIHPRATTRPPTAPTHPREPTPQHTSVPQPIRPTYPSVTVLRSDGSKELDKGLKFEKKQRPHQDRRKHLVSITKQAVFLLSLFALGLLLRYVLIGQLVIIVYAVLVFVFRVESRITFALALISLGVVLIGSILQDRGLANTYATYAFLLLVVGLITMGREARRETY